VLKRLIVLLLLFYLTAFVEAASYYVANAGNDSCNGTSSVLGTSGACAWATISKVNVSSFSGDDQMLFNRGDVWRESLVVPSSGTSGHQIIFDAYGSGNAPSIRNSTIKSSTGDWTNESGNLWYTATSSFPTDVGSIMVNGTTVLTSKQSAKGSLASQGDFFYDSGNTRVYLYSVGNPASFYSSVECWWKGTTASNGNAVLITKNYITFQNFDVRYTGGHGIQVNGDYANTPTGVIIQNNTVSYIGGSYLTGTTRFGNGIEVWDSAATITVQNNTISQTLDEGISSQSAGGMTQTNISFLNNSVDKCGRGFSFGAGNTATSILVSGNSFTNNGAGWSGYNGAGVSNTYGEGILTNSTGTLTGWNITRNYISGVRTAGIRISSDAALNVDYNIVQNSYGDPLFFVTSNGSNTNIISIRNNTFYDYQNGLNPYLVLLGYPASEVSKVVFKNNIVAQFGTSASDLVYVAPSDASMTLDYNLYYRNSAGSLINYGGVDYTQAQWAAYKAASLQDSHSPVPADPLFMSTANNDFRLKYNSPAAHAGTTVSLTQDFQGRTALSTPSIGALEYYVSDWWIPSVIDVGGHQR
jgi:hypothetical protein